MLKAVYTRTLAILKKVPLKLWGLSLLSWIIMLIAAALCTIPLVVLPVLFAVQAGMVAIFYKNYTDGVTPDSKPLFVAYKDFQTFKHIAGGMGWRVLWIFLWCLIPIAGPFIAVYKSIQYIFTTYILLEEPSVRALDALKKSKEYTKGYKGQIFLGIVLPYIAYFVVLVILTLLTRIPYAGILFAVIYVMLIIVFTLFAPLFFGLVEAGFYEYCRRPVKPVYSAPAAPAPAPAAPVAPAAPTAPTAPEAPAAPAAPAKTVTSAPSAITCPTCGSENSADKKFCSHCGAKLQ